MASARRHRRPLHDRFYAGERNEPSRHVGYQNDHAVNAAEWIVYDALYAYCQEMVRQGKPKGDFVT